MITREYLITRRTELATQQQEMMARAEQARVASIDLGGSIRQVDELLAMLPAPAPAAPSDPKWTDTRG